MRKVEKTVFISYRRHNIWFALAVYQNLSQRGYDVFFDYNSIDSGDFEQIILNNITSRAHFLFVMTNSALERANEPDSTLRSEIECAIESKRNIVSLTQDNFDWDEANEKYLYGQLEPLKKYNSLRVPADYFNEAMDKLCNRHLNIELEAVLHPRNPIAQAGAEKTEKVAEAQPIVQDYELTAQEYFEIAFKYAIEGKYEEAIENYSKAIELKSDASVVYTNRGNVYAELGNFDLAIGDYDKAIQLNPDDSSAYHLRGTTHHDLDNFDAAFNDFDKAIQLNSNDAVAYYNRGLAHYRNENINAAMRDYSKAIQLDPDYTAAYTNRGNVYAELGNFDLAIGDYDKAIQLDPGYALAYTNRGNIFRIKGEYKMAVLDYDKALHLNPDDVNAYNGRGIINYINSHFDAAIYDYNKVIQHAPNDASAYNNRGEALFAMSKFDNALEDFKKAMELNPSFEFAIAGLAVTQHKLDDAQQALNLWKMLIGLDGRYEDADRAADIFGWHNLLREEARELVSNLD